MGILDIEQGGKKDISDDYWLTDITLSNDSWCYINGQTYKEPSLVIRNMIDVWSKKGIVLLNISPMANGVINTEQRFILATIGKWINKHKEAVYETRPYSVYGYGEAAIEDGHFGGQSATIKYSKSDIRFTVSKDNKYLYVYSLGLPNPNAALEIRTDMDRKIKRVSVVGSDAELRWSMNGNKLTLQTPSASDMDELATVFRIEFE